jgi:hypothetical protein
MKNKNIIRIALVTLFILLIPLIAMQFSDEVKWGFFDFVFAGTLLFGTGLAYELVARKTVTIAYRVAVGIALAAALFLVWINAAVGIIGDGPVNVMYFGVIAVLVIGAAITRLEPQEMARALFVTALAQALVPVIALIIWKSDISWEPGVLGVFILNTFFVGLWIISAMLFRHAASKYNKPRLEGTTP